jgi:hypothetical protein
VDTRSKRKTYAIGNQYPSGNVGNLWEIVEAYALLVLQHAGVERIIDCA